MTQESSAKPAVAQGISPAKPDSFPVVGIGSSAGGIEALGEFFDALPDHPGMAFVIVQHLDPESRDYLPGIIRGHTRLPVHTPRNGAGIQADNIYVAPADKNITLEGRTLRLSRKPERPYIAHSIDLFFRSLAEQLQDKAIGVVLSGMGSDGAFGAKLINHRLGMVMVQEPASAKFSSMPEASINIGVADYVLPPSQMPEHLLAYVRDYYGRPAREREKALAQKTPNLEGIFTLVRQQTSNDLSIYKLSTVYQRIGRRMSINHIQGIAEYTDFLARNQRELETLVKEFLIRTTRFFQDPEAFEALKVHVKGLLQMLPDGSILRAWSMGCGTGEETYSFAIIIKECLEEMGKGLDFRLFATDVDPTTLGIAHTGLYPGSVLNADVTPERLSKYFIPRDEYYQVNKEVRDRVLFSIRDFAQSPPFVGLDLINSRVSMTYFNEESQHRLIPVFHFTLNPKGILFLGTEDSMDRFASLFQPLDARWTIYQRKG